MPDTDLARDILRQLMEIRGHLEASANAEQAHRKAFDALYEELRQYKEDFIFQAEKPLLLDLLLFYDSLNWFQRSLREGEMSVEVAADSFQYLIDEFLEVLYRRDVQPMEPRERFDRKAQKAVKALPTRDPEQHERIAQVLKRGFTRADRVLRPEEVVVYLHRDKDRQGGS